MDLEIRLPEPNQKQLEFFRDRPQKHVCYGGARGGGKSWAVRMLAIVQALRYPGAKILLIRRTYPELVNNHIRPLRQFMVQAGLMPDYVRYNDTDKRFDFFNESLINATYMARDEHLDRLQGTEWDFIFIDESTMLSEYQIKAIAACLRGTSVMRRHVYYTCNPGGQSHAFHKRVFVDRDFRDDENPDDYVFIPATVYDNVALQEAMPEYVETLRALPDHLRKMWLEGCWDVYSGMVFERFLVRPLADKAVELGMTVEQLRAAHRWCHVIEPFDPAGMTIFRSYDFGYARPFSFLWFACREGEDTIYLIEEYYGCTKTPNEGVRMTPDEQFEHVRQIEANHPYLRGKRIRGVADPACWKAETGISVAETAAKYGIILEKADNSRLSGLLQCQARLQFDANGYPSFYVFDTCKEFIRTIPTLMYDEHKPEDVDTSLEDHAYDAWRYMMMARPIATPTQKEDVKPAFDPLERWTGANERRSYSDSFLFTGGA